MIPKFGAWQKYHKRMLDILNIEFNEKGDLYSVTVIYPKGVIPRKIVYNEKSGFDIESLVLMQSTGVKDISGVEVFEGDIFHWKDLESFDDFMIDELLKVEYSNEFLKWIAINKDGVQEGLYDFSDNRTLKVIGNIYENPELLEV